MLLIEKGFCTVVENVFLHLEIYIERCPESDAGVYIYSL